MPTHRKPVLARIDWPTLLLVLSLITVGIMAVYTSEYTSFSEPFFNMEKSHMKQLMWLCISCFIGFIILFTDSKVFYSLSNLSYVFGIFLLLITFVIGGEVKGSHSFIKFGSFTFQPGEACKIFTALALARFLSAQDTKFNTLKDRLIATAIVMIPCVLIILQNETGLALVYFAFFLPMYREGLPNSILIVGISGVGLFLSSLLIERLPLFIGITVIALLCVWLLWRQIKKQRIVIIFIVGGWLIAVTFSQLIVPYIFKNVFKGYQVERIYSMLGQDVPLEFQKPGEAAKKDADYNVRQSKIAIGSGGLAGKGIMNGTQTKYSFVPEQHTDFVFCGIGEQFGFIGSMMLVLLYLTLLLRIVVLAERQRSVFSRVYCYCVASILFFHFAINLSMTMGLAPVIGITLPMLSYGGTSLLSFSVLIFIMLRLDADRHILIR
ncbi:rod shape-determining protein RodA [Edaphocola aurantiacus]|uniref:rod shape-determining protein RodA n=1 Tax=Edaphocola aurantiacus TaxID=2601682 RepID=UPI001C95E322|nr:rod shape-determining protein RodA [Edaphocola aurantiacus]